MTNRSGWAVLVTIAAGMALSACGSDDKPAANGGLFGGSGGSQVGDSGLEGGDDDAGGSSGSAGSSGSGGTGAAGTGGTAGMAPDASDDAAPDTGPVSPCAQNLAFWAVGTSFKYPTPQDLAQQFNSMTYDPDVHPLTIILRGANAPDDVVVAASATEDNGSYSQVFPADKQPEVIEGSLVGESFSTIGKQNIGYLRLVDDTGPIFVQLEGIEFSASLQQACSIASVNFTARIPESQGAVSFQVGGETMTLESLAGPVATGSAGWDLSATFSGESTKFDFGSLYEE